MLTPRRAIAAVSAFGLVLVPCATAAADPGTPPPGDGPSVTSDPRGGSVGIGVTDPGTGSTSGALSPSHGGTSSTDPCVYTPANPPPPPDTPVGYEFKTFGGAVLWQMCPGGLGGYIWVPPGKAKPVGPSPAQLALRAYGELRLPSATLANYPSGTLRDGRPYVVVRTNVWFWATSAWGSLSKRVCAGAVCAAATAKPSTIEFDPGDGSGKTVTCQGPASAWPKDNPVAQQRYLLPGSGWAPAPAPGGCSYLYEHSTYGVPDGMFTATYAVTWTVAWTGTGGAGGTLAPLQTTTTQRLAVAEAQAVIVR